MTAPLLPKNFGQSLAIEYLFVFLFAISLLNRKSKDFIAGIDSIADKIIVYMSPKIIGVKGIGFSPDNWITLSESKKLSNVSIKTIGNNVRMEGYLTNVHRDN